MSHSNEIDRHMLEILEKIIEPGKIDLIYEFGSGWGIWGNVLRIQLEYTGKIVAFEKFERWATILDGLNVYDKVHGVDCLEFENYGTPDLVLVPDLIEHLPKEDSKALLDLLDKYPRVVITTPLISEPKERPKKKSHFYGNPLLQHISNVSVEELEKRGYNIKLVSLRYFPRWIMPFIWVREKIRGVALAQYEIIAWKE